MTTNPAQTPVYPKRLNLRWRFDYVAAPSRYGSWDYASGREEDTAERQPKAGLRRATIEARDVFTGAVFPVVEMDGHMFVTCRGIGYAVLPATMGNGAVPLRPVTRVIGISFWTPTEKISVYVSGNVVRQALTSAERGLRLREHTAGA